MNRAFFFAVLAFCMILSSEALRGALFRSGRSLRQNQIRDDFQDISNLIPSKRSAGPLSSLYPVVTGEGERIPYIYFRL